MGYNALDANTTGNSNCAFGINALTSNTTGINNVAIGKEALNASTVAEYNTAVGLYAMLNNSAAGDNVAIGSYALYLQAYNPGNAWSSNNVAIGSFALGANQPTSTTNGVHNTATGNYSLRMNTIGLNNTSFGFWSMYSNSSGSYNAAFGVNALDVNTTGSYNTAIGYNANVSSNNWGDATAIGSNAISTGTDMVVIGGPYSGIISIGGYANWSNFSDGRFKENVRQDVPGLAFIEKLNPVTYTVDNYALIDHITQLMPDSIAERYHRSDLTEGSLYHPRQTGFIAQEVEAAAQETGYDFDGVNPPKNPTDHYSISYASFVVPLVKAVQEQQDQIEQLKAQNAALEARLAEMERKLAE
jgi:hypothetical protein